MRLCGYIKESEYTLHIQVVSNEDPQYFCVFVW